MGEDYLWCVALGSHRDIFDTMVIKKERQVEYEMRSEPKLDLSVLKKRGNGKSASGIILGYMKKFKNVGNIEMTILFQEIYKQIKNLETSERFRMEKWKGKSGIKFIEYPDKVICICHQKFDKGEKPKEIKTELTKDEINQVIYAINNLFNGDELIETSDIAELVHHKHWDKVFSTRKQHIKLTKILNYLEYKNCIHYYRTGKTKVLTGRLSYYSKELKGGKNEKTNSV